MLVPRSNGVEEVLGYDNPDGRYSRTRRSFLIATASALAGIFAMEGCKGLISPKKQTEWNLGKVLEHRPTPVRDFESFSYGEEILNLHTPDFTPCIIRIYRTIGGKQQSIDCMFTPGPPGKGPAIRVGDKVFTFANTDRLNMKLEELRSSRYVSSLKKGDGLELHSDLELLKEARVTMSADQLFDLVEKLQKNRASCRVNVLIWCRKTENDPMNPEVVTLEMECENPDK